MTSTIQSSQKNQIKPFQHLWSFDPSTSKVHILDAAGKHPADYPHHSDIEIHHPERIDGYALPIQNGYRIFNSDLTEADPYVTQKVKEALEGINSPSLPSIRYHGDPGAYEDYYIAHRVSHVVIPSWPQS
jgi:hypothetical protein